jgi:hypothetical protein
VKWARNNKEKWTWFQYLEEAIVFASLANLFDYKRMVRTIKAVKVN